MKTDVFKVGGAALCLASILVCSIVGYGKQKGAFFMSEPLINEIIVGAMVLFVFIVGYVLFIIGAAFDKE